MRWIGLLPIFILAACATGAPANPAGPFAAYVGKSDQALIERFGVPDRSYTIGGKTFFTYDQLRVRVAPGGPGWGPGSWGYRYYGYGYGWGMPVYAYQTGCVVTLEIEKHVVRGVNVAVGACE